MKPQAIFIDIDNTLIPHGAKDFKVSLENILAIKNAQKKGIYVVIATGRSYFEAINVQKQIRFNKYGDYLISNNAASIDKVGDEPKNLWESEIELSLVKEIINYAKKNKFLIRMSQEDKFYGQINSKIIKHIFKKYGHEIVDYKNLDPSIKGTRRKIGFLPQILSLKKIKKTVAELNIKFPNLEIGLVGPGRFIEVNAKGVSKAKGLAILAKELKLDLNKCAAIGDSNNDIEMFKVVGISIAMENANQNVKKYAKFETAHTKKSGVAKAINSIYEIKEKDEY